MGIIWLDGFEEYTDDTEMEKVGYGVSSTRYVETSATQARTGSRSLYTSNTGSTSYYDLSIKGDYTELWMGAAFYFPSYCSSYYGALGFTYMDYNYPESIWDGGVRTGENGEIWIEGAGTVLGTTSTQFYPLNGWFYLEVYVKKHNTAGEVIARLNGSVILSASGVDALRSGTYITHAGAGRIFPCYIDDFYIADDGFHGPLKVHTFTPDADGTYTDFTRNTGSNDYEMVDEDIYDGDTTYVEGDAQGQKSSFGITTSGITGPIKAIGVRHWVSGVGDGPTKITPFVRSNSTDYSSSNEYLVVPDYYGRTDVYETDPDDSNPWTTSKLDNAEFGIEITSLSTTTTTTTV
jgi:hypothetical protein